MKQIYNFSSGPAMLPERVLDQVAQELKNWNGLGTSVMEISHRSKDFITVAKTAEKDFRDLLNIPNNYKVLFCQGGARGQFAAIPGNLLGKATTADYINSGYWSNSAFKEAKKFCFSNLIDVKVNQDNKQSILPMNDWQLSDNAAYIHFCPNETIEGIEILEEPNFNGKIVVADFSSAILSRPINVKKYGVFYAGAQKNIGPSGLTIVVVREDLLGKSQCCLPSIFDYKVLSDNFSMFNTPPTFIWYISGLVFKWLKEMGGIVEIYKLNQKKSNLLYDTIDNSDLYYNDVSPKNRSRMNVPFHLKDKSLNEIFLKESFSSGLHSLKGHRVVGGMRASIYNAMPLNGVKALAEFMVEFERRYG